MDPKLANAVPPIPPNTECPKFEFKKKRLDRIRKKDEKNFEQFLKSISNLTPEEKIEALCKKNADFSEEIRNLSGSVKLLERRTIVLEKEKEQLQSDQSKGVVARARLENLCRELQRQNKAIKDESLAKIREEEEKRKEVSTKFQSTLNDVTAMMQQNSDKNLKLRDDNIEISAKFQKLCDQFKQREEEVNRMTKQMDLEKQLADATLKRVQCQLGAEKETWKKEKEDLFKKLRQGTEEKYRIEMNMKILEEHLSVYSNKYEEFESTISKSNRVFDGYKVEMTKMSKQVSKLEHDCGIWKDRWLQTSKSVNRLLGENQVMEAELKDYEKKIDQLTSLSRFLQEERGLFMKQLKDNSIEPLTVKPAEVETKKKIPTLSKGFAITKKERELKKLRQDISDLQSKINIAVQRETEEAEKNPRHESNRGRRRVNKSRNVGKSNDTTKTVVEENGGLMAHDLIKSRDASAEIFIMPNLMASNNAQLSPLDCGAQVDVSDELSEDYISEDKIEETSAIKEVDPSDESPLPGIPIELIKQIASLVPDVGDPQKVPFEFLQLEQLNLDDDDLDLVFNDDEDNLSEELHQLVIDNTTEDLNVKVNPNTKKTGQVIPVEIAEEDELDIIEETDRLIEEEIRLAALRKAEAEAENQKKSKRKGGRGRKGRK